MRILLYCCYDFDRIFNRKKCRFWRKIDLLTEILTEILSVKKSLVKMSISTNPSEILTEEFWRTDNPSKFQLTDRQSVSTILAKILTDWQSVRTLFNRKFWGKSLSIKIPKISSLDICARFLTNFFTNSVKNCDGSSILLTIFDRVRQKIHQKLNLKFQILNFDRDYEAWNIVNRSNIIKLVTQFYQKFNNIINH